MPQARRPKGVILLPQEGVGVSWDPAYEGGGLDLNLSMLLAFPIIGVSFYVYRKGLVWIVRRSKASRYWLPAATMGSGLLLGGIAGNPAGSLAGGAIFVALILNLPALVGLAVVGTLADLTGLTGWPAGIAAFGAAWLLVRPHSLDRGPDRGRPGASDPDGLDTISPPRSPMA